MTKTRMAMTMTAEADVEAARFALEETLEWKMLRRVEREEKTAAAYAEADHRAAWRGDDAAERVRRANAEHAILMAREGSAWEVERAEEAREVSRCEARLADAMAWLAVVQP